MVTTERIVIFVTEEQRTFSIKKFTFKNLRNYNVRPWPIKVFRARRLRNPALQSPRYSDKTVAVFLNVIAVSSLQTWFDHSDLKVRCLQVFLNHIAVGTQTQTYDFFREPN